MSDDSQRREAAMSPDLSRHAATGDDSEYSLSIEEALLRYEAAGLPRTTRSIQRYCAKGDLDAHRVETTFGEKFLITPASVDRHIAYINEVRLVATSHDLPRHVATEPAEEKHAEIISEVRTTSSDEQRQVPTSHDMSQPVAPPGVPVSPPAGSETRVIELLESENEFLRGQVAVKDKQIEALNERVHETNVLTVGLQQLLTPLLTGPDRKRDDSAFPHP